MKVLVIGSGGREHAIIMKLAESKKIEKIYCAPGNGGISAYAECFPDIKATDINGVAKLADKLKIDYVFVAPDDPLVMGMVDVLNKMGFKTFGPNEKAAIIEGSKAFSKNLMKKYNIPTAEYATFDKVGKAVEYIKTRNLPIVIKADGLALGKGVLIAETLQQAADGIRSIMQDRIFGESGDKIVIEEFLRGPEISVLCFTDGTTVVPMMSSMDHKRALDGDKGLNTGGMGTIAPNPYFTKELEGIFLRDIAYPTINAMKAEGRSFKGCLYFGLMLTSDGLKVIEYNCRFGDPETQVILPLLKTDLADIIEAVYEERLSELNIEWKSGSCVCVIMASGGYPRTYQTTFEINGLDEKGQLPTHPDTIIFHAGTKFEKDVLFTNGGRVIGVTSTADTLQNAVDKAYAAVKKITFNGAHYRKDIGAKAISQI